MSLAPGDLPLLLAGPVLRRVEGDLVCVWIATSQPCNASLLLFDGGDVAASDTPFGDQRAEWVSDVQATLPIGPHLHVLAITLGMGPRGVFIAITISFSILAVVSGLVFRRGASRCR